MQVTQRAGTHNDRGAAAQRDVPLPLGAAQGVIDGTEPKEGIEEMVRRAEGGAIIQENDIALARGGNGLVTQALQGLRDILALLQCTGEYAIMSPCSGAEHAQHRFQTGEIELLRHLLLSVVSAVEAQPAGKQGAASERDCS